MKMVMLILRVISTGRCPQSSNSPPPSLLEDKARDDRFQEKLKYIYIYTHITQLYIYTFSSHFDSIRATVSSLSIHSREAIYIYIRIYPPF